jgi:hypothetical protein
VLFHRPLSATLPEATDSTAIVAPHCLPACLPASAPNKSAVVAAVSNSTLPSTDCLAYYPTTSPKTETMGILRKTHPTPQPPLHDSPERDCPSSALLYLTYLPLPLSISWYLSQKRLYKGSMMFCTSLPRCIRTSRSILYDLCR